MTETLMPGGGVARRPLHFIVIADPLPVADVVAGWQNLEYAHQGRTNMGAAFREVSEVLGPDRLERRALRPAILLITDGLSIDPPGEFEAGLEALTGWPAGRAELRVAVVSRLPEEGAGRAALPQTLMHPPGGPAPGPLDDSIL